jgi:hypothetical protein
MTALRLGSVSSSDELAQLWAIDKSAYGEASLTYEQFADWCCIGISASVVQSACGLFLDVLRRGSQIAK